MNFKRMKEPTGVVDGAAVDSDAAEKVVRPAILVHSGPDGEGLVFNSMDGETKPFDKERIQRIVDNQNELLESLAKQYGGWDKMPAGAFPPLLDGHDNASAHNVLGRMMSKLRYEVRDVPKVGKNVSCAVTDVTFLGKDNVAKVKDGRVYHLSVGIDENADTLGETSAVVEPAAPGAMLLSKGKQTSKGATDMSQKKLAAHKAKLTKLAAMQAEIKQLSTKLVTSSENVRLAKVQGEISGRLTKLMKSGKLTPAEVKKIDVKKLSTMASENIEVMMSTFEALEPKINAGQKGTSDPSSAVDFGSIGKSLGERKMKQLRAEVRGELKKLGANLGESKADEAANKEHGDSKEMADKASEEHRAKKKMADEASEEHRASVPHEMKEHLSAMAKHLESGNMEGVKACHAAMCKMAMDEKHMSGVDDVKSEDYKMAMEHLEGELDEVKTNLARMAGMVEELMSAEVEEGHDLGEPGAAPGGAPAPAAEPGVKA